MSDEMLELKARLGLAVPVDDRTEQERARDEALEREFAGRGAPHGLSAAEVRAADRFGMSLAAYASYRGARSMDAHDRIRAEARMREEAARDAAYEDEVARARRVRS